jgi:deazaflavin-dependent oxidoreductase (nitroreductase family)
LFSYGLHHIDKVLLGVSQGRISIPRVLGGLPVVRLTTTGAKTGKKRTTPVLGFRDDDGWFLIASNWGSSSHPAWYHNLSANPEVTLSHDGGVDQCVAREVTGETRQEYWRRAEEVYPGYKAYQERSGDRQIPVITLTPKDE